MCGVVSADNSGEVEIKEKSRSTFDGYVRVAGS